MSRLAFSSLRTRLILLVLFAIIPTLGLIVYDGLEERHLAAEAVKLEVLRLTQIAEGELDNFIEDAHSLFKALSELPEVQSRNAPAVSRHFAALIKHYPYYTSIGAVDAAGNLYATSLPTFKPINAASRLWFQRVLQTRHLAAGDFQHGGITGKPVLVLGYPVLDKRGALTGMVFVSVDLSWLNQTLHQTAKKTKLPPEAALLVIDRQGTILARHPDHERWVGKVLPEAALIKTILTQKEGLAEEVGIDGIQRLFAFTPIHGPVDTGLYLSAGIPKAIVFDKVNRILFRNLVVLGLVAALALAAAGVVGELFLLRPVKTLGDAAEQLAAGDLSARSGLSYEKGEIGQLARTFDDMAQALERRAEEVVQAEKALLRERETRIRAIMDNVIDGIITIDERGLIESFNPAAERIFGYASSEVLGQNVKMLMPEPYHSQHDGYIRNYLQTGKGKILGTGPREVEGQRKDGSVFPMELATSEIFLGQQRLFIAVNRDLTERKKTEDEIKHSYDIQSVVSSILHLSLKNLPLQEILQQTMEIILSLPWLAFEERGGIFLVEDDPQTLVMKAKKGLAAPIQEACARVPFGKCLCGRAALTQKTQFADRLDEHHDIKYEGISPHGHYCVPVLFAGKALGAINVYLKEGHRRDEGEIAFLETVANTLAGIIQRRRVEAELRKLSRAVEQNPASIVITDTTGAIEYVNPKFTELTGYALEEVLGQNPRILQSGQTPPEEYKCLWNTIVSGGVWRGELCNKRKNGDLIWESTSISPVTNETGVITHFVAVKEDITERKRLGAQLLQAQKMEAVGTLAGGVAHDFNNLLTTMTVNLELAKAKLIKGESQEAHLEEIDNVIQRAAALTRQLLAFSRRQIIQPVSLNLNDTINQMNKMLSRLIGEHIELEMKLEGKLGLVKADPGQMEQVIMNLCVNARDAMPEGGKLFLVTHNINLEDDYLNMHPGVEKGQYVLLEVCDTGQGMDEATLTHIFEPFFTTKETGKGTGLGLAMVYGIIKQHEGHINVYSEPGQGTTFKIYLHRTQEKVAVEEVKKALKEIEGGRETILLAEDEEQLQEAIRNILEMFGYTVLLAQDGQEAVEVYEREKERIDLVILDAVMPRMGGMEAAEYIYKLNPSQKILFSSGYSAEGLHQKFIIPEKMHFIQKPYRGQELTLKVREVLEG